MILFRKSATAATANVNLHQETAKNVARQCFAWSLALAVMLGLILNSLTLSAAEAKEVLSGTAEYEVEVGSPEAAEIIQKLRENYPKLESKLDELRLEMAKADYGSTMKIEVEIYEGQATDVVWTNLAVGVSSGLIAAAIWTAFGGEIMCALGFVPACACVGPQC